MLLRPILIRLLLLAVFFNTVIGLPAHEAGHLPQAAVAALSAELADEADDAATHGEEADGLCAWCFAYAHLGAALTSPPSAHAAAVRAGLAGPPASPAFIPSPGRWPFAARDPPLRAVC